VAVPLVARGVRLDIAIAVALGGDARPVIDCVTEPWVAGVSLGDTRILPDRLLPGATPHKVLKAE
jgi:hypothetical protein